MMRLIKFGFLTALAVFFVTSTASAVEISINGATSATIVSGGTFTITLGLDNAALDNTPGFEGNISGLAAAGADVVSGQAATGYLCGFVFPGTGCLNGVASVNNAFYNPADLAANFTLGDDNLLAINVAGASFSAANGAADLGLANDVAGGTHDPNDAIITFTATAAGVHNLTISGVFSDGVNVLPMGGGGTFTLTVIPEPGTALLMGLGLAGLAAAGRRE